MFVVATDFDLEPYNIPNLNGSNSFEPYVSIKEEMALRELLGNVLYDRFIAGLAALPLVFNAVTDYAVDVQAYYGLNIWKSLQTPNIAHVPVEGVFWTLVEKNKWLMLRDGDTYSTTSKWVGMKKLLVPYVYSYWVGDAYDKNTGVGVVKAKGENSTVITPKRRIVRTFNEYVDMAGERITYWPRYGARYNIVNSLYGFITVNADSYPDFAYCAPQKMNIFNL